MFGFSKQKTLVTAIKNACDNELKIYEDAVVNFLKVYNKYPNMSEDEVNTLVVKARRDYLNTVCDKIWNSFAVSSPKIHTRFRLALMNPSMTGLPDEMNVDYFSRNGISAGAVFAFAYFALTDKRVDSTKMFHTMSTLNHYQDDLMNEVLKKYDS